MLTDRTFNNKARAKQLISFEGLCYPNNITPTDIDVAIEFHDKSIVLGELKHVGNSLLLGQRLLLERFVNNFEKSGKYAIAFIAKHSVMDTDEDVIAAEAIVEKFYMGGKWKAPSCVISVKELIDWFLLTPERFWINVDDYESQEVCY